MWLGRVHASVVTSNRICGIECCVVVCFMINEMALVMCYAIVL
jgi:hypothetical protein